MFHLQYQRYVKRNVFDSVSGKTENNRPFPSSPQVFFHSESKCEIFVMIISSNFNMNEN